MQSLCLVVMWGTTNFCSENETKKTLILQIKKTVEMGKEGSNILIFKGQIEDKRYKGEHDLDWVNGWQNKDQER